ncbi:formate dehydrogenase subunit gamma [Oceanicoccus sp. KOV_DT_Chl]|uniref:formate dehydrogenase subunit gamma n=1 Tax=Oceanicoccus sp. KOV_DT_Chl TaxID=1904639 RepID=UPI001F3509E8|nr:formate dehydrogenase subunit gamma [Oceanicoccus sp. KOV_DT_Chl]
MNEHVTTDYPFDAGVVSTIVNQHITMPGALLPILHALQNEIGFIPAGAVPIIADGLNLSRAEVHGVISFYHYFKTQPVGRHTVQICRAESCQAMGSRQLEQHAKSQLNIDYHQTTADGEFYLEPVYCLGNCACSPSMRVGDAVYSHVSASSFDAIIDELSTTAIRVV